jgi:hypothetical protein
VAGGCVAVGIAVGGKVGKAVGGTVGAAVCVGMETSVAVATGPQPTINNMIKTIIIFLRQHPNIQFSFLLLAWLPEIDLELLTLQINYTGTLIGITLCSR